MSRSLLPSTICLLLLAPGLAAAMNTDDMDRSENVEDRRLESALPQFGRKVQDLENARQILVKLGAAAEASESIFTCGTLAANKDYFVSLGKMAEAAGPVQDAFPADTDPLIAGIFESADLQGVDPCTGAIAAEQAGHDTAGGKFLRIAEKFEKPFGAIDDKIFLNIGQMKIDLKKDHGISCRSVEKKAMKPLENFLAAMLSIKQSEASSHSELQSAALYASKRSCEKKPGAI